ncbi:MAG: metallophosphatase family protein [Caldilineae bacterium]|nr:MAG: metallophosphatase family protein [Caldilineae bacterium]
MSTKDPPWPGEPLFPANTSAVAILSDVHGNIRALDAILDDIAEQGIDAVACNGDLITSSAHASQVVARLMAQGIPCTRGNHERYLRELDDPTHPKWGQANWAPTCHDYRVLDARQHAWLRRLPDTLLLCDGEYPLLMSHAAPGNDCVRVCAQNKEPFWRDLFAPLPRGCTLVGSHLHWFWRYSWHGYQFVRTPSAGLPLDGDTRAGYVILRRGPEGWQAEQRRIPYDVEAELAAFRASDYYREGGVVAHLFWEELRTARSWVLPFFAHARKCALEQAADPNVTAFDREQLQAAYRTFDRTRYPEYNPDAPGASG